MDTPLSDKQSQKPESSEPPQQALHITLLLGPPMRGVDAIAFAEVAAERSLTREQFWLQVVLRNAEQLLENDAEGRSKFDDMVSEALGKPVTLWDVEGTVYLQGERRLPGLVINPKKVLDILGRPTGQDLVDREVLSRIANAAMDFTRADSSVCILTADTSEFIFPILRKGVREEAPVA